LFNELVKRVVATEAIIMTLSVGYLKHIWSREDLVLLAHVPEPPYLASLSFKSKLACVVVSNSYFLQYEMLT